MTGRIPRTARLEAGSGVPPPDSVRTPIIASDPGFSRFVNASARDLRSARPLTSDMARGSTPWARVGRESSEPTSGAAHSRV